MKAVYDYNSILGLVGVIERDIYFWRKPEEAVQGNRGIRITFSGQYISCSNSTRYNFKIF